MAGQRLRLKLRDISEIPYGLISGYHQALLSQRSGPYDNHIQSLNNAELKIGAFAGDRLVGFVVGNSDPRKAVFELEAIYADKIFSGKGVGKRLFRAMCWRAEQMGYQKVELNDVMKSFLPLLEKESKRLEKRGAKEPKAIKLQHSEKDKMWQAGVSFKGPKPEKKQGHKKPK